MKIINKIPKQLITLTNDDCVKLQEKQSNNSIYRRVTDIRSLKGDTSLVIVGEIRLFCKKLTVRQTLGDNVWSIVHYKPLLIADVMKFDNDERKKEEARLYEEEQFKLLAKCKYYDTDEYLPSYKVKNRYVRTGCFRTAKTLLVESIKQGIIVDEIEDNPYIKLDDFIDDYMKFKFIYVCKVDGVYTLLASNTQPKLQCFNFNNI